jgi:hypothetical protein
MWVRDSCIIYHLDSEMIFFLIPLKK